MNGWHQRQYRWRSWHVKRILEMVLTLVLLAGLGFFAGLGMGVPGGRPGGGRLTPLPVPERVNGATQSTVANVQLAYYGGPILHKVTIQPLFLADDPQAPETRRQIQQLTIFYKRLARSPFLGWLAGDYGVPGLQPIGPGYMTRPVTVSLENASLATGLPSDMLAQGNETAIRQLVRQMALQRQIVHIMSQTYVPVHLLTVGNGRFDVGDPERGGPASHGRLLHHHACGYHSVVGLPMPLGNPLTGGRPLYYGIIPNFYGWPGSLSACEPSSNRQDLSLPQLVVGPSNVTQYHASRLLMNAVLNPSRGWPNANIPPAATYAPNTTLPGWTDRHPLDGGGNCDAADCCAGQWGLVDAGFRKDDQTVIVTYVVARAWSNSRSGCVAGPL